METTVGQGLRRSRWALAACGALAAGIVAADLLLARSEPVQAFRLTAALAALVVYGWLGRWDRQCLGLRLTPRQGWLYWLKVTLILGGIVAAVVVVATAVAVACGVDLEQYRLFTDAGQFWPWALHACLVAPILEEAVYRFVLCTPAAALVGAWPTVLLSGCVFAALHFIYGNPAPDNCVAGFLLAWAYLKSGSLLVPVGLHGLGNLCVGLVGVAECCWW